MSPVAETTAPQQPHPREADVLTITVDGTTWTFKPSPDQATYAWQFVSATPPSR